MTTLVTIRSPYGNQHGAVAVHSFQPGHTVSELVEHAVLGQGERWQGYLHDRQALQLTEVPRERVPASAADYTLAERMAGVNFNPSNNSAVAESKALYAAAMQEMMSLRDRAEDPEVKRLASIAITNLQTAQMFATKALTWRL